MRVLSAKSAHSATTLGCVSPSFSNALPNPSRVGSNFTSSLMFALDFAAHGAQLGEKIFCFFGRGRLAVPVIVELYLLNSFAGDGVGNNDGRFFIYRLGLVYSSDKCGNVVAVDLYDVPVKGLVLGAQVFKRHHLLCHAVDLYIIAVNNSSEVGEQVVAHKHRRLPRIACVLLAVAHKCVDAELFAVHTRAVGVARRLAEATAQGAGGSLHPRQLLPFGMSLQAAAKLAQSQTFLMRKVARMRHRGVAHGANVPVGEEEPVALLPMVILGVVLEDVEVKCGKYARHAQGARRVAAPCRDQHLYQRLADICGFCLYLLYFFVAKSH